MQQTWQQRLQNRQQQIPEKISLQLEGRLVRMSGLALEAVGIKAAIGARCMVDTSDGEQIETEVVGFSGDRLYLMPTVAIHGLLPNARVVPKAEVYQVEVGEHLLGRILDGRGMPLDGKPLIGPTQKRALYGQPLNPLSRNPIRQSLDVGIRAINALLTVGRGQRLGLFAGSGVGKSVLLGMMTRYTKADVVVVGLIGERGREVKEFVEDILGVQGLARAVVVAAPADTSPLMRLHGAMLTHSIAEHFRDNGKHVLLLMDSLTRFAQAQREVALAVGEMPATKGYPPSVFARLPQLVERAGNGGAGSKGSITGFYTVLAEGDDQNDPIADAARAILDGHLVLSRRLAESGHYPAIDIEASISRTMPSIVSADHLQAVQTFRRLYSAYESNRDLINVGAYQTGSNAEIDLAIKMREPLLRFLAQSMYKAESILSSHRELLDLIESCKEKTEKPPAVVANTNVPR